MAQDELGHARATYPVLAKLGHPRDEDGLDTSHALPMLRDELPDWASMIAANLVIDGILTTWIAERARQLDRAARPARAQDPPGGGRAQGPRGGVVQAHLPLGRRRPRAAAPADRRGVGAGRALARTRRRRRLPRGGRVGHARLRARRGARVRCATGSRRCSRPKAARRSFRSRNGSADLPVLRRRPDVEDVAQWGGQIITRQVRCRSCNTYFEVVRDEFDDPSAAG